jgi:beta-phosphoglucomutase-like phosphatase (HAD superfamily)
VSALGDLSFSSPAAQANVTALIFDVEGTLVDCVCQTLESWRETLADFGLTFSVD